MLLPILLPQIYVVYFLLLIRYIPITQGRPLPKIYILDILEQTFKSIHFHALVFVCGTLYLFLLDRKLKKTLTKISNNLFYIIYPIQDMM